MRTALVVFASLLVHAGFIVAGLFYFPQTVRQFTTSQIVPLELITEIADVTNLPEEEVEEEPVEEEAPPPVAEPEPEPEPEIDMNAAPETEAAPEPEPEPEPEFVPDPEPEAPAQPPAQTAPQPAQPAREQSFDDMLRDLASSVDRDRSSSSSGQTQDSAASYEAIGVTLADSIRSQAQRCYRGSADAPDPERLIVMVRVRLNRDGSLDGPPEALNRQAIDVSGDRYWRVARERALAAVIDCAPYRLPAEYFSIWRRIDVTFRNET
ncbi:cell envelope integrity protein TolA [Hyphobacterium sp. CCMP332]|uniref:cell envelope integrity protein TolA n=1 Tax=Hyphobacterium sp. CCMP332 TaxID=2749086 RepID=UPI00164F7575|nr:cell envelope integrity protein TolA [Hyphobacterium sp. CCMP332]QNL17919.1 cell envelope integrity protein TolA [Hyphobacterium sp. CCMP332]